MQPLKKSSACAWTDAAVFDALRELLPRVAPLKVTGPVSPETSLALDLDFDSLDTIELLYAANDAFGVTLDFESWLAEESQRIDTAFTVLSLGRFILKALEQD